MRKILFICNRLPNNENAGGILYNDIIKTYGIENFSIISVSSKIKLTEYQKEYLQIPFKQYSLRLPNSLFLFKVFKKTPFLEPIILFAIKERVTRKIIKYAKEQNCEIILAPLRGDVLLILNDLIEEVKLPLIAMVEDTVEREIDDHRILYDKLKQEYYKLIVKVQKLAVAGETMQRYFKTNFNLDSVIIRPSYVQYSDLPIKHINKELNIFFSGNLYAKNEMNSFLEALPLFSKNNPMLKITMYIASHFKINYKFKDINIVNLGWISENQLNKYMEDCHISYLPYKSEPEYQHSMMYAFPGKAGFYIANNLPVFFHGPTYSSFNTFLSLYNVGISCNSMDKNIIANKLEQFIKDPSFYENCQIENNRAYLMEFSDQIFSERVESFLS